MERILARCFRQKVTGETMAFLRPYFIMMICLFVGLTAAHAQELRVVRISYAGTWDALPAIVAAERGFLAKEGIYMSGVAAASPETLVASLASGATDFAVMPQTIFLQAITNAKGMRAIAINDWGAAYQIIVPKDSEITTVAALKGKKIALINGTDSIAVLIRLLNAHDLKSGDVTVQGMSAGQLKQAFGQGYDAVIAREQLAEPLRAETGSKLAVPSTVISSTIGFIGAQPLVASPRAASGEKETIAAVQRAWVSAHDYIAKNPDDAARLLRIYLHRRGVGVAPGEAAAWVKMQKYNRHAWDADAVTDANYNAWALTEANVLKATPDMAQFVN